MSKKLLFLDDWRNPFDCLNNWLVFSPIPLEDLTQVIWVKSYNEFVEEITKNGLPDGICYDHDLGWDSQEIEEKSGFDCAKWLVEYCIDNNKLLPLFNSQSANPVGKENILSLLNNYKKHENS